LGFIVVGDVVLIVVGIVGVVVGSGGSWMLMVRSVDGDVVGDEVDVVVGVACDRGCCVVIEGCCC
jgi:hypothetical protein